MPRCLFIDLIEGKHSSRDIFRSLRNLEIEYVTDIYSRASSEYDIVVIHGHGENTGDKTILHNYGESDKGHYDENSYKCYDLHYFSEMLKGIQGKYVLVFIACNSYSSELSKLINENCIAVIASNRKLADDLRMLTVISNLLIPLCGKAISESDYNRIEQTVDSFNTLVECKIFSMILRHIPDGELSH